MKTCLWTEDPDGYWATQCGNAFCLEDGTPEDNRMEFCPYCGGMCGLAKTQKERMKMDSRQAEREALGDKIEYLLRHYRLAYTVDDEGEGYPLVDAVTPPDQGTITMGIEELHNLADDIVWLLIPAEAQSPK